MSNSSNEKKSIGKMGAVIIVLAIAIVISFVIIGVAIVSIVKGDSSDTSTNYDYSYVEDPDLYQTTQGNLDDYLKENLATEEASEVAPDYGEQNNAGSDNKKTTKNVAVENYEKLSKNGENRLSDHYDNQYIKLVSGEYGVDTDLLVAIYSVPDTGTNFVLEFDGTKDATGNYVKSPDTLSKVYQIDKERNISVATGNGVGNVGVSYAEGIFCFNMVKTIVMEQYPDYFTGIE